MNPIRNGIKPEFDRWCGPRRHSENHGIIWLALIFGVAFLAVVAP